MLGVDEVGGCDGDGLGFVRGELQAELVGDEVPSQWRAEGAFAKEHAVVHGGDAGGAGADIDDQG